MTFNFSYSRFSWKQNKSTIEGHWLRKTMYHWCLCWVASNTLSIKSGVFSLVTKRTRIKDYDRSNIMNIFKWQICKQYVCACVCTERTLVLEKYSLEYYDIINILTFCYIPLHFLVNLSIKNQLNCWISLKKYI